MFRDGIFQNFGDFLDKIKEDTLEEAGNVCTRCGSGNVSEVGSEWKCLDCGHVECATGDSLDIPRKKEESKLKEDTRKVVPQTMQPKEETPKDDAEKLSMEDWSDTDKDGKPKRKDKVEYPSTLREPEEKEFDQTVKYERKKYPLHLCNECFKTFRSTETTCIFCESKETERIGKIKEAGSDVPFYKSVFAVQYKLDGEENEWRGEAFDEADAKKYVMKIKPGASIISTKKIGESKVKEAYAEQHPGTYTVTFYDNHKEVLDADSQKDAAAKAREIYKKEDRIVGVHLDKRSDPVKKGDEGKFTVIFVDGHKEVVDAEHNVGAMKKARALYKDEHRILQVNPGVMEKVEETVQELVGETPGINRHEQEILNWAIENNVIPNQFPSLEEMIDDVLAEDVTDKYSIDDPGGLDLGEIEAVWLKYVLLPKAKKEYASREQYSTWERPGEEELGKGNVDRHIESELESKVTENNVAPKVKLSTGSGTSYYAECPECNTTNWLSEELTTDSAVCKKCGTPFKLGEESEHEVYIKREVPERKVNEGSWWQRLLNDVKKDKNFKSILDKYGTKGDELFNYFSKKYWAGGASTNSIEVALKDVLKELNLEESKIEEQGDTDALRAKRLDIEQKMLDAEKKYQDEQNRMGAQVDAINKQIKAKEEAAKQ